MVILKMNLEITHDVILLRTPFWEFGVKVGINREGFIYQTPLVVKLTQR